MSIQNNPFDQDTVLSNDLILNLSAACLGVILLLVGIDAITDIFLKKGLSPSDEKRLYSISLEK